MQRVPMWRRYLRFFGPDVRADVGDELRFHIETKVRELTEQGMPADEARRVALRHFGDMTEVRRMCEQIGEENVRKLSWKDRTAAWRYDIRLGARSLARAPWFTAVALITLAAGIGGAASLFSVVDGWIIHAVRFPNPGQLVFARGLDKRSGGEVQVSYADYADMAARLAARARMFQSLAAVAFDSFTLSREGPPERVIGASVSANFFDTLGAHPVLGRGFLPSEGEFGHHRVAIVSYGFWKARLNGDPSVIGWLLNLNGEPYTVVGVLPESFHFTLTGRSNIWVPLALNSEERSQRQARFLRMIGRMKPGVTVVQARQELQSITADLAKAYPDTNLDTGAFAISLSEEIGRHVGSQVVLIVFGVTIGLLLIACSNVANLLLVRAVTRKRQAAIQLSVGASRGRLVRQALVETLMLFSAAAVAGSFAGIGFARLITSSIPYENRGFLPDYGQVFLNWRLFAFSFAVALVTGLFFGLAPAFEATGANLTATLKEAGSAVSHSRKARRARWALVTGQVIIATVLLCLTAVLVQAFRGMWTAPLGFESAGVLTFRVSLDERQYADPARRRAFFDSLLASVDSMPGEGAAIATSVPFGDGFGETSLRIGNEPPSDARRPPKAGFSAVTAEYFRVLKTPLLAGRMFERADSAAARPVAIVNEAFVKRYLAGRNPLGRLVALSAINQREAEIVGVVTTMREDNNPGPGYPEIYVPFAQAKRFSGFILMRTAADPLSLLPDIRRRVASIDPSQPVYEAKTLEERLTEGFAPFRIVSGMLAWFGLLALVVAAIGIYGVVAFSVSQRTREIGIRSALGADRFKLQLLFLRQGLAIMAAGIPLGLLLGGAAAAALRGVVENVAPAKLVGPLALTAVLLSAVVLVATLLPARRAASVDPVLAIRYE